MKRIYKILIAVVVVILAAYLIKKVAIIRDVSILIISSFIISYGLKPLHKKLVNLRINKSLASIILILVLIVIVILVFTLLIPSIFKESLNINNTLDDIQKFVDNFYEKIQPLSNNKTMYVVMDNAYEKINKYVISIFNKMIDLALDLGGEVLSFAVVPIIVYYFLADSENIFNKLLLLFPVCSRSLIKKITKDMDRILSRYIISQFLLCAIIGVLTFIVLAMLHIRFPVILSILNATFNIIPYFGPLFGALPAILMALLQSPRAALYTAIWLMIIQQIEGNILSPKITGDSISMHPLTVILLLLIGGKIGGFLGMVLAVPIGVMVKVIYDDLNYYLF